MHPSLFSLVLCFALPSSLAALVPGLTRATDPGSCTEKFIKFDSFYRGSPVRDGDGWNMTTFKGIVPIADVSSFVGNQSYVETYEWSAAFDTAYPSGNDPDLGAPNEKCEGGGPGIGDGGVPGSAGENCLPRGKVVIAHRGEDRSMWETCEDVCADGKETEEGTRNECLTKCQPNDYEDGATFVIQFENDYVDAQEIILMDIGDPRGAVVKVGNGTAMYIGGNGDNSITVIDVTKEDLKAGEQILIQCFTSCGLASVKYLECDSNAGLSPGTSSDIMTPSPGTSSDVMTPSPGTSPDVMTPSPGTSPDLMTSSPDVMTSSPDVTTPSPDMITPSPEPRAGITLEIPGFEAMPPSSPSPSGKLEEED